MHTRILLVPLVGHGQPGLPRDRPPEGYQPALELPGAGPLPGDLQTATGKTVGAGPLMGLRSPGYAPGPHAPRGATKPSNVGAVAGQASFLVTLKHENLHPPS